MRTRSLCSEAGSQLPRPWMTLWWRATSGTREASTAAGFMEVKDDERGMKGKEESHEKEVQGMAMRF